MASFSVGRLSDIPQIYRLSAIAKVLIGRGGEGREVEGKGFGGEGIRRGNGGGIRRRKLRVEEGIRRGRGGGRGTLNLIEVMKLKEILGILYNVHPHM